MRIIRKIKKIRKMMQMLMEMVIPVDLEAEKGKNLGDTSIEAEADREAEAEISSEGIERII